MGSRFREISRAGRETDSRPSHEKCSPSPEHVLSAKYDTKQKGWKAEERGMEKSEALAACAHRDSIARELCREGTYR